MNRKPRRLILAAMFTSSIVVLLAPRAAAAGDQITGNGFTDNQMIGRLFYTPHQRSLIDARRQHQPVPAAQVTTEELPPTARYNGSVLRSGGRATGWVGGVRLEQIDQTNARSRLQLNGRRLAVRTADGVSLVEPGQTLPNTESSVGGAAGVESPASARTSAGAASR
mgnify:FL=1